MKKSKTFRTELFPNPTTSLSFNYEDNFLLLGSCFSDNIGNILAQRKFKSDANPFGTLFNPISIFECIEFAANKKEPLTSFNTEQQSVWFNHHFHSTVRGLSENELNRNITKTIQSASTSLTKSSTIVLTLGTAIVYKKNNAIVANCHKSPSDNFTKSILSIQEIVNHFNKIAPLLENKKVVLTVSPVRHIKDTIEKNSVSKAILRLACEEITSKHTNCYYFPSYELMMDDLRDYRYYQDDMIHPNNLAINYIWEKFSSVNFDSESLALMEQVEKIQQSINHRAFNPNSDQHQAFLKSLLTKIDQLPETIDFEEERKEVIDQIIE